MPVATGKENYTCVKIHTVYSCPATGAVEEPAVQLPESWYRALSTTVSPLLMTVPSTENMCNKYPTDWYYLSKDKLPIWNDDYFHMHILPLSTVTWKQIPNLMYLSIPTRHNGSYITEI